MPAKDHIHDAVSQTIYQKFFQLHAIQFLVHRYQTPLIVVNVPIEEIVTWIN